MLLTFCIVATATQIQDSVNFAEKFGHLEKNAIKKIRKNTKETANE